jgi:RNA polymerase sigma factor (sigma-70 family)
MDDLTAAHVALCTVLRRALAARLAAELWAQRQSLTAFALQYLGDPDAVADCLQEAAYTILLRPTYRGESSPWSYLCGVLLHKIRDQHRRTYRGGDLRRRLTEGLSDAAYSRFVTDEWPDQETRPASTRRRLPGYERDIERALELSEAALELSEAVHAELAQLPPVYRMVLLLRYGCGHSVSEIRRLMRHGSYKATEAVLTRARTAWRALRRHRPSAHAPRPGNPPRG